MKYFFTCFFSLVILFPHFLSAQQTGEVIYLKNGRLRPVKNITLRTFKKAEIFKALAGENYYLIVQFERVPSESDKEQLKQRGLQLEEFISGNIWLAVVKSNVDLLQFHEFGLTSALVFPPTSKISSLLQNGLSSTRLPGNEVAVTYFASVPRATVVKALEAKGIQIVVNKFEKPGLIFIDGSMDQVNAVAELPYVTYIAPQVIDDVPINYYNNAAHSNTSLTNSGPGGRGLSGKGVTIGVGDNGDVSSHVDFTGRLINRTGYSSGFHATHTTGTATGAGILDIKYKGMAPRASIVSHNYSDIIINTPFYILDYEMNLTSNSYTSSADGCPGNGSYDILSNYVDAQAKNNSQVLHVFAAGNDGAYFCDNYPRSFATIKSGWQVGKNVLTVGSCDNYNNIISDFSSRGPLKDGRIKPEIVAGGSSIYSTIPNNTYGINSGTSMAAPTVAGSLALLTQRYKELNGNVNPKAALLKALVCNSAEDRGNPGPDFTFGFGHLNSRRAVEDMEGHRYFASSISHSGFDNHFILVPAGATQLKVLITWTDKEAAAFASTSLINDLDLSVLDPNAVNHLPLILTATPAGVNLPAVEGADHKNNIEQVVINNPAAGIYTLSVKGFSVPFGPQEYVVTYEYLMAGVTVEYPAGGESIVPGEVELIRWSAYGNENHNFTIEYSDNNGSSWLTLANNVAFDARSYAWTAPAANATSDALIRISVNETAYSDQSDHTFSMMERPSLNVGPTCPGSIALVWSASAGATSYDILTVDKDSMKVIGNTTSTFYYLYALTPTQEYWYSIRPRKGTGVGRQSISRRYVPIDGPCTGSAFNDDLQAVAITAPVTAREFTSTAPNATQPIKVQIKNGDNVPSSASFDITYSINGGTPVTETIAPVIAAGTIYTHTFAQHTTLGGPGSYDIKVWLTKANDILKGNDTAKAIVKLLANPALSLPFTENFENAANKTYLVKTTGLDGLDNFDFNAGSSRGRARSFVNSGFAYNGNRAITLDQSPYSNTSNADSLVMTNNLSNYSLSNNQVRLDFQYRNQGADNLPGNKVWVRGNELAPWIEAYDLYANQAALGNFKAGNINLNEVLLNAVPPQDISSTMQVKFGQEGYNSTNSPVAISGIDDGYTFDEVKFSLPVNDLGLTQIISPAKSGCGLSLNNPVIVKLRNYSNGILNNVQISYSINGATPVTETISQINALQILDYTFTQSADLSAFIEYSLDVWVNYGLDNYRSNDSLLGYKLRNSALVNSFPYLENFEASNGSWYSQGTNSAWQWGTPSKTTISSAANGSKAWVTSLTATYQNNTKSFLYSPCFDITGLTQPVLSFSHISQIEDNCACDYHWVEYSIDGGFNWLKLGAQGSGTNWYDDATTQRWQHSRKKWHVASIDLPTGNFIRFRFILQSDNGVVDEGVGIDDIHIFEKMPVYTGPSVTTPLQEVNGNGWINFTADGKRIVSINPNGQNLGPSYTQVYFNAAGVRNEFNQYYLDRNIVIRPLVQPLLPVTVRYYFTDQEAEALMNATGCATCTTIGDPYKSAIMKYSGQIGEENGTLADNTTGTYYVIPGIGVEVIPYDNGYYAEFTVNSFSEFWINNGIPGFAQPYVFTGNGNWNVSTNWSNNNMPPSPLPADKEIIINPVTNCTLNINFTVLPGGKITVISGKNFVVQGNLNLQ